MAMNENRHPDAEILAGLRRRLSAAEPLIPQPPAWHAIAAAKSELGTGVVVRSRVAAGSFAALALVAAVVVVAVGFGLAGRPWSGNGPAESPGNGFIGISYQLVHPAGTQVTSAELDATRAVLMKRVASLGATSYSVNEAPPDGITVSVEGFADAARLRRVLGQAGRLEFVLLPPEAYGTGERPGSKPVPSTGDSIDPSLPAQFTGADLDLGTISASTFMGSWVLDFAFTEAAAGQFETWSGQHVDDYFAIVLDGKVLSVPYIKSQITGGKGMISGLYTAEQAQELAAVLQSGWLPLPLREVTTQAEPSTGEMGIISPATTIPPGIATSGRTIGDPNAPVTLDVWIDYQCPACRVLHQESLPLVIDTYVKPGKVRIVYHDFLVIDSNVGGHESLDAANAARCAADQGKFAAYQDWLFANQGQEGSGAFSTARLEEMARRAGLDTTTFQPCVENGTHGAEIQAESSAVPSSANAVPAVFVNGTSAPNPTYDGIVTAIEAALRGAQPSSPTSPGVAPPSPSAAPIESAVPVETAAPSPVLLDVTPTPVASQAP
jgi:protein-disulfide isomerase